MEPVAQSVIQYRIPAKVDRVFAVARLIESHKDPEGNLVETREPEKWFVHLTGSTESLCLGPEQPDLRVGDVVDIIIRKQA